jgi:hypothetical protein
VGQIGLALALTLSACSAEQRDGGTPPAEATDTSPGTASSGTAVPGSAAGTTTTQGPAAGVLTVDELLADAEAQVGEPVTVVGRFFLVALCPPPGPLPESGTCELVGRLAEAERTHLLSSQLDEALPLVERGQAVSCREGSDTPGWCRGWKDGEQYSVEGTLRRRVLGGRETSQLELEVSRRIPH